MFVEVIQMMLLQVRFSDSVVGWQGLLLPLCASGTCTLREAIILTSAIKRTSIPVLHSAAALMRLADMPYSGTTSFFIRVLLDKKYSLPYRVVHPPSISCMCLRACM